MANVERWRREMRLLTAGLILGVVLGTAIQTAAQRMYLFNGHELFNHIANEYEQSLSYTAGIIDSITWIAFGGRDAAQLFVSAGKCLHNSHRRDYLQKRDLGILQAAVVPGGSPQGWHYVAPAPRVVADTLARKCR